MNAEKIKAWFKSKTARIVLLCLIALLLLFAVWRVFFKEEEEAVSSYPQTELEQRLSLLLQEIDGVTSATVMIGTDETGAPVSVVVIFQGDGGILTRNRIAEVAVGALGVNRNSVLVYPAHQS